MSCCSIQNISAKKRLGISIPEPLFKPRCEGFLSGSTFAAFSRGQRQRPPNNIVDIETKYDEIYDKIQNLKLLSLSMLASSSRRPRKRFVPFNVHQRGCESLSESFLAREAKWAKYMSSGQGRTLTGSARSRKMVKFASSETEQAPPEPGQIETQPEPGHQHQPGPGQSDQPTSNEPNKRKRESMHNQDATESKKVKKKRRAQTEEKEKLKQDMKKAKEIAKEEKEKRKQNKKQAKEKTMATNKTKAQTEEGKEKRKKARKKAKTNPQAQTGEGKGKKTHSPKLGKAKKNPQAQTEEEKEQLKQDKKKAREIAKALLKEAQEKLKQEQKKAKELETIRASDAAAEALQHLSTATEFYTPPPKPSEPPKPSDSSPWGKSPLHGAGSVEGITFSVERAGNLNLKNVVFCFSFFFFFVVILLFVDVRVECVTLLMHLM